MPGDSANVTASSSRRPVDPWRGVFALVSRVVWETIARASPRLRKPVQAVLREAFEGNSVAEQIYSGSPDALSEHVRELAAVKALLANCGIAWAPPSDPGQDYADDMRQYLGEARRSFATSPVVLAALREYEREVADLLHGD